MQSVTSNAVAVAIAAATNTVDSWNKNGFYVYKIGRFVFFSFSASGLSGYNSIICNENELPARFKPIALVKIGLIDNNLDNMAGQIGVYNSSRSVQAWSSGSFDTTHQYQAAGMYLTEA